MKYHIQFEIKIPSQEKIEIAVAMLSSLGIEGFEEVDYGLIATVERDLVNENEIEGWLNQQELSFKKSYLEEQNWNELWEKHLQPVIIDDFAGIRASFHPPIKGVAYDLIITPKMSFGTGHHATTRQMIQLMRRLPFSGSNVFDFGTGTGVLAILAHRLGAKMVEAIDIDEWSILNATENCAANQTKNVKIWKSETLEGVSKADIILANINKNVILEFLPQLVGLLNYGGWLVLSGLLCRDEEDTVEALDRLGYYKDAGTELDGWIAFVCKKRVS